jgi:hypothetical protein
MHGPGKLPTDLRPNRFPPLGNKASYAETKVGLATIRDLELMRRKIRQERERAEVAEMYGPPSDCKGKVLREKVCVNVSGLFVEICSPGHDEIRRVPVL